MSNTNNTMQTKTSNTLHNAIMEAGGKDRSPMLAPGNYVQWKSIIKRYIDTKRNHELIYYCLKNPPYEYTWADKVVLVSEGSPETTTVRYMENYKNVSQDIRNQLNAKAKAVQIILTGIDNDIYSIIDACPNACETWKAIERLKQDDEMSKDKEIDKLMALISLSFKKISKPINNNLRTSSNMSRANQDNSPRINRGTGYDNQRLGNVVGARETVEQADWRDDADDESEDQELEAHYMYMAQLQEVTPDAADNSGPIFDTEPLQKVPNDDNYNVFAIESENPEQSKSVNDTYPIEQDAHNVIIDSLDMSYDREQIDQDDDDDLANERDLLASLIKKLKCEINDSKNRNKFLETSNKVLVDELKGEIEDFKTKNKCLESSNNHFKEANNKLSNTNELMYNELLSYKMEFEKSSNVYTQKINDLNQMISDMKKELFAHQETISILSQAKEAQPNLNAKTSNVNFVCVTCGKCVLKDKHDICVLNSLNGVKPRTKMPMAVPISTREPKRIVNKSVAKPLRRTVVSLIEMILFIVDYGCSKHMTGNLKLLINFVEKFLGTVKFRNDQIAPILGYGDLVQRVVTIKRVYYVEGLNHNLFSVGQLCDADPEVAFQKSTCYIRDLKGNDLLIESINGRKYVLVIVDDYSRYTWTHFLRSKDETPEVLIDFVRLVQRGLHAKVRTVRTDKGTEF
nr:hypothetical protein [Tanacetum cinerariifolium]